MLLINATGRYELKRKLGTKIRKIENKNSREVSTN